jgi:hypothetical protein
VIAKRLGDADEVLLGPIAFRRMENNSDAEFALPGALGVFR